MRNSQFVKGALVGLAGSVLFALIVAPAQVEKKLEKAKPLHRMRAEFESLQPEAKSSK